jgi:hypothetical protein
MVRALSILLSIALALPPGWCCLPATAFEGSVNRAACREGEAPALAAAPPCCRREASGDANQEENPGSSPEPWRCDCHCAAPRGMIESSSASRELEAPPSPTVGCCLPLGEPSEAKRGTSRRMLAEAAWAFPAVRYQILYGVWRC